MPSHRPACPERFVGWANAFRLPTRIQFWLGSREQRVGHPALIECFAVAVGCGEERTASFANHIDNSQRNDIPWVQRLLRIAQAALDFFPKHRLRRRNISAGREHDNMPAGLTGREVNKPCHVPRSMRFFHHRILRALTYVVDRFKGWAHGGHITLKRGERSRLADFASEALQGLEHSTKPWSAVTRLCFRTARTGAHPFFLHK